MDSIRLPRWALEQTKERKRHVLLAGAVILSLLLISSFRPSRTPELLYQPIEKTEDGVCTKTLLYRFDDRRGFGSEITMFARAVLFANAGGFALLIDDSHWNYGRLGDYFMPRSEGCQLPDDAGSMARLEVGQTGWQQASHLLTHRFTAQEIDRWVIQTFIDLPAFWQLPPIEYPLPHDKLIPPPFTKIYNALSDVHEELFRPRHEISEAVATLEAEYGMHGTQRSQIVGVHFRGSDKCFQEQRCVNVTTYAQMAIEALDNIPPPSCRECTPILVLMTIESHMGDVFRAEPLIADRFEVRQLPPSPAAGQTHDEDSFLALPMETRVEDTQALIRDVIFLSSRADAVVASMNSNIGLVMAQWTPSDHLLPFSVDGTFWPTSYGWSDLGILPP